MNKRDAFTAEALRKLRKETGLDPDDVSLSEATSILTPDELRAWILDWGSREEDRYRRLEAMGRM